MWLQWATVVKLAGDAFKQSHHCAVIVKGTEHFKIEIKHPPGFHWLHAIDCQRVCHAHACPNVAGGQVWVACPNAIYVVGGIFCFGVVGLHEGTLALGGGSSTLWPH